MHVMGSKSAYIMNDNFKLNSSINNKIILANSVKRKGTKEYYFSKQCEPKMKRKKKESKQITTI